VSASLAFLTPRQVEAARAQFRDVYQAAFARPPYSRDAAVAASFGETLRRHTTQDGFRCAAALDDATGLVVGFAYGYTSQPGQWWHDQVARALAPRLAREYLDGAFELVELAVAPARQGQRLGSRLHDELLASLPHPTAVLSTMQAETVALRLYQRRGWVVLLAGFLFSPGGKPYYVMGLKRNGAQAGTTAA
jgi:ribosomal protein S18 acetylase RimI-like enzyme